MCDCISQMNEKLAEHNTVLTVPLLGEPRAILSTYRLETGRGKKKAVYVFANFCPFCGERYEHLKDEETRREAREEAGIQ